MDIRSKWWEEIHTLWCSCIGGDHRIVFSYDQDGLWDFYYCLHNRTFSGRLRAAWDVLRGGPVDGIVVTKKQLKELHKIIAKEVRERQ